jgi:preprotein translocase subunit SecG
MITLVRFLLGFLLVLTSLFLILLVLIQRGRGGGLSGAFGGAGGQSAFGTKAGDVFTRITVGVAAFWIGLCILAINLLGRQESLFAPTLGGAAPQAVAPQDPGSGGGAAVNLPAAETPPNGVTLPAAETPANEVTLPAAETPAGE